jgi:outer membrane protein TolC
MRISQLEEQQNQTLTDLQKEIASTTILLNNKLTEVEQNAQIIQMAEESLKNALVLYEGGQENILNVLDAQSVVAEQSIIYREAMAEYLMLIAKLHFLQGNDTYPFNK